MRRLSTVGCVSLLLALALSPVAVADPSWAKVSAELKGTDSTNVTNLAVSWSRSDASVSDSLLNSDSFSMWGVTEDTSAPAAIATTASGHAKTGSFYVSAESIATPPPDVESYSGWNRAHQEWTFQAATDGLVRFDFDLSVTFDLQTALLGEKASGGYSATLWLFSNASGNGVGGSTGFAPFTVQDGTDAFAAFSQPDGIQFAFAAGESGLLVMEVKTYGSANTVVPVPAALLLGMLGLGTAGVKLRGYT